MPEISLWREVLRIKGLEEGGRKGPSEKRCFRTFHIVAGRFAILKRTHAVVIGKQLLGTQVQPHARTVGPGRRKKDDAGRLQRLLDTRKI